MGRLSREKGQRDLIDAGAVLNRMESALKFKLVVVGEGPERESLERASREQGLSAQVLFIDHVEDVAPYYAIADALALPSHSEGSPNVLLEAMAAGVPVVATKVGGVPEIAIDCETALLVPPHDPQLFANAVRRILIDADLAQALSDNAKTRASHFSPEAYARSLISIYEDLASATLRQPRSGLMNLARSFKAG